LSAQKTFWKKASKEEGVMLKILLIDDEPDMRRVLGEVLRADGHQVEAVPDGESALTALRERPAHLAITDVRLPRIDGLTLLRRIRREHSTTEVLVMTAFGSIGDAVTAMKDSAVDYLLKPFDLDRILSTVALIDERQRTKRGHA
jgi:DNA-binding NtrC family response regulator